jgi:CBS domain-containing protein
MTTVREVMTGRPVTCNAGATIAEAAQRMRESNIGDVLVERDGKIVGLVTDRDIVVRAVADGRDPTEMTIADVCSHGLVTIPSDAPLEEAVALMREQAVRRLPVVEQGHAVGMVSVGDLALHLDDRSALADISAAPPNT